MDSRAIIAEIPSFSTPDGALDIAAMQRGALRVLRFGFDIAVMAFAGEYNNLTLADHSTLLAACAEAASDSGATIYVGAFEPSTQRCIEVIKAHAAIADCVHLVLPSFYFGLSNPEEIERHYMQIQRETGARILAVNSPAHTGIHLHEACIPGLRLRTVLGIEDVLNACTDMPPDHGPWSYHTDDALVNSGAGWSIGLVSRAALLFPHTMRNVGISKHIAPEKRGELNALFGTSTHPAVPIKYAAHALGLCAHADPLPPTQPLDAARRVIADAAIESLSRGEVVPR